MDYCDPSSGRRPPAPQAAKEAGSELAAPETEDADEAPTGAAAPGGAEAARREAGAPASAAAAASAGAAAAPRAAPWLPDPFCFMLARLTVLTASLGQCSDQRCVVRQVCVIDVSTIFSQYWGCIARCCSVALCCSWDALTEPP